MPTISAPNPGASMRIRSAFEKHAATIEAVPDADLRAINVDVPVAITTTLGSWAEIQSHRAVIAAELPSFDLARFDKLEEYTLALAHAHAAWVSATKTTEPLPALVEEATKLRDLLYSDATALSKRGLFEAQTLTEYKTSTGYRALAFDLLGLGQKLSERWITIEGKTAISTDDLRRAEDFAERILQAVGAKEQHTEAVAEASRLRQRAYSLYFDAYDQARRAITYLRWDHDDLEEIIPSLFLGRGGRKKAEPAADAAPANGGRAGAASPTAPGTPAVALPGGDPFAV